MKNKNRDWCIESRHREKYSQNNNKKHNQLISKKINYKDYYLCTFIYTDNFLEISNEKYKFIFLSGFTLWTVMIPRITVEEIQTSLLLSTISTCLQTWDISLQCWNWDDYPVFSSIVHLISRLLLDEIYPLLGISIWLIWLIAFISTYSFIRKYCKQYL